jgi:hypothetical protein
MHKSFSLVSEHAGGDEPDHGDDGDAQDDGAGESRPRRITTKDIWGLAKSATCAEALAILHFKDIERKRKAQVKAARDEERESRRRKNVVGEITKALILLEKVAEGGLSRPPVVKSFLRAGLKGTTRARRP